MIRLFCYVIYLDFIVHVTGDALLRGLHGPFYLFLDFGFLLIFDHSRTCVFLSRAISYFGQRPRLFASNQGAQCFFPICFCVNVACMHPLRFQSNSNLFPTLAQPFVFDLWPWPGCLFENHIEEKT